MTQLQKVFIKNLKRERSAAGLTQERIAERIGIAHKYYGALELGYRFPSVEMLEKIAKALGVAAYTLFVADDVKRDLPTDEVVQRYNRLLERKYKMMLSEAGREFLGE